MTNIKSLFPRSSFVGFDYLMNEIDQVGRQTTDYYPPHNIIKVSASEYTIQLAVAGFKMADIDIEVNDRTLVVIGEQNSIYPGPGQINNEYIHRGISSKRFVRSFKLSEYVQVDKANLSDGILAIELKLILPEEKRSRKILIS